MNASYRLFFVAALFALGTACWLGYNSSAQEKGGGKINAAKWEYKITELSDDDKTAEKELNKLGDEGWELVGTTSKVSATGGAKGNTSPINTQVRLIFKKAKK